MWGSHHGYNDGHVGGAAGNNMNYVGGVADNMNYVGGYHYPGHYGRGRGFAIIVVLFILLIIVGASKLTYKD